MIEGHYQQLPNGDYVTTGDIEIRSFIRPPDVVVNAVWAAGKCSLIREIGGSLLEVKRGYEWGGVSGPELNLNAPATMEATLHHDALCQALRGLVILSGADKTPKSIRDDIVLNWDAARTWVDECFKEILRRDNASGQGIMSLGLMLAGGGYAWPKAWPPATKLIPRF